MATEPEHDIEEALIAHIRTAITVAARGGQILARERERVMRATQEDADVRGRALMNRMAAERAAARAQYAPVYNPQWWDNATAEDIGRAWETIQAWQPFDDQAIEAGRRMVSECYNRYDLDVALGTTTIEDIRQSLDDAERAQADHEASKARDDEREAAFLSTQADLADERATQDEREKNETADVDDPRYQDAADDLEADLRDLAEARAAAEVVYDSAERRENMAAHLRETVGDVKVVDTRVRADHSQGRPAQEATTKSQHRAPTARKRKPPQLNRDRQKQQGRAL